MAYSPANPVMLLSDAFGSGMPRLFFYRSTHASSEIARMGSTLGTSDQINVGFFAGVGEGSHGLNGLGLRLGDIVINVTQATLETTDNPYGFPGICTVHSVIASTANGSTLNSSVAFDVSLSQSSL